MELLTFIIVLALVGLVVGAFARLALPGPDPMSIPMTIGIGLAGSFVGGLIGRALFGEGGGSILLSIICAAIIVYFVRRSRGGGLTDPGAPRGY
ncbi:MAG TPA: GlsB/YeaQ/YmgE family stress response membrane protein [Solirubrobacteraceae bacterium]|nr:GlsB/YeaQ/YmgE family stress response membrane protein [Solirubrobacteraceae bacterium]